MKDNQKYIIRCKGAGVFVAGIIERRGDEADLRNARRIWQWQGATECIQLAQEGANNESRVTMLIPTMTVLNILEVLPCSEAASKKWEDHPVWKH